MKALERHIADKEDKPQDVPFTEQDALELTQLLNNLQKDSLNDSSHVDRFRHVLFVKKESVQSNLTKVQLIKSNDDEPHIVRLTFHLTQLCIWEKREFPETSVRHVIRKHLSSLGILNKLHSHA